MSKGNWLPVSFEKEGGFVSYGKLLFYEFKLMHRCINARGVALNGHVSMRFNYFLRHTYTLMWQRRREKFQDKYKWKDREENIAARSVKRAQSLYYEILAQRSLERPSESDFLEHFSGTRSRDLLLYTNISQQAKQHHRTYALSFSFLLSLSLCFFTQDLRELSLQPHSFLHTFLTNPYLPTTLVLFLFSRVMHCE